MRCDLFHIPEEFPHLLSWMEFQGLVRKAIPLTFVLTVSRDGGR